MRIAFWGSSLVSAYWNGAATYYRGILRALARYGHDITFYEPDAYDRQKHRDIPDPDWAKIVVYNHANPTEVGRLLRGSAECDVVVKASGVGVLDEFLETKISSMPESVCRVFWDVDAPATLDRIESDKEDQFHHSLPKFHLVLTYGGGQPVTKKYHQSGARRCVAIYNALDPDTHYPVSPDERFRGDLSFLGNRLPDREVRVEDFFLRAAALSHSRPFVLGGSGWSDKARTDNVNYVGHVYTADHNGFNCSARLVLNISRESMARYGFSPATRVFEAAGAGACLITDAWEGIELFLKPEEEVLVAKDGEQVAHFVDTVTEQRARAMGVAARKRILEQHTYERRGQLVNTILEETVAYLPTRSLAGKA